MPPPTDSQLLSAHLSGDPSAFPTLLRRHIDMIHAAALRQSPSHADDITQATFLLLHQKAATLRHHPSLAGWLFTTTRLCASHSRRADSRRRTHEHEAAMHTPQNSPDHTLLLSLLDDALASLRHSDRELILLHHLQSRPFEEIAAHLQISIPAASRRTQRALDRLRDWFARRGTILPAPAVSHLLLTQSTHHAPTSLATAATSTTATSLAKTVTPFLLLSSLKTAAAIAALLLLFTSAGYFTFTHFQSPKPSSLAPIAIQSPVPPATDSLNGLTGPLGIAQFDLLLDAPAAAQLKKIATNSSPAGDLYTAYRSTTAATAALLRDAQSANQLYLPDSQPDLRLESFDGHGQRWNLDFTSIFDLSTPAQPALLEASAKSTRGANVVPGDNGALRMNLSFTDVKLGTRSGTITFDGQFQPGDALLLLADSGTLAGHPMTHVLIWQTFKAADYQWQSLQRLSTQNMAARTPSRYKNATVPLWIESGSAALFSDADRALVWQFHAPATPIPPQFVRTLPNGAKLRLAALGSPATFPMCWWRPDGTPSDADWAHEFPLESDTRLAAMIELDAPPIAAKFDPNYGTSRRYYSPSNSTTMDYLKIPTQVHWPIPTDSAPLDVGAAVGPWTDLATIHATDRLEKNGVTLWIKTVDDLRNGLTLVAVDYKAPPDLQVRVLTLDNSGTPHGYFNDDKIADWPSVTLGIPSATDWQHLFPNVPVKPADIDHFLIQTRHREWTTFSDYALSPSTSIPDSNPVQLTLAQKKLADMLQAKAATKLAIHRELLRKSDPSTPAGAKAAIVTRARAGDVAGVRALYYATTEAQAAWADAGARSYTAYELLYVAAEKRYSTAAFRKSLLDKHLFTNQENFIDQMWEIDGNRARPFHDAPNSPEELILINGNWCMLVSNLPAHDPKPLLAEAQRYESLKSRLDHNEFPTIDDFVAALNAARQAAFLSASHPTTTPTPPK